MVHISTTFGSQGTIETLGKILQERMTYMRETARDSVAAMAINMLRSLRTVTKVVKKSSIKVDVVEDAGLYPSCYSIGRTKKLCLRHVGSKARYSGPEKMIGLERHPLRAQHVYRFTDNYSSQKKRDYLIISPSIGLARKKAKQIAQRRGLRYAGLAKRALGILMYKTNTKKVNDGNLNPLVENTATMNTRKFESVTRNGEQGKYTLVLNDDLRYALKAIKGGQSSVETQMKKAANKIVSIINQKIGHGRLLGVEKLETPFPSVRQRKGK